MHELAIAESLVTIACEHAAPGRRVTSVGVRVGALRQVVPSSLAFGFELLAAGTPVEGAELELEAVPAAVRCRACGQETEQAGFPLQCGGCGGFDVEVTRGEELQVEWVEIDDAAALSGRGVT